MIDAVRGTGRDHVCRGSEKGCPIRHPRVPSHEIGESVWKKIKIHGFLEKEGCEEFIGTSPI